MSTNVVMVVVDALRADRVGSVGGRELTSHIDELAADAAVFSNAFSTTNATDSAVTTLLTGRYPLSHGIVNHGRHVTNEELNTIENIVSLPKILSTAGYHTAKIGRPLGRWHRSGFDTYPDVGEQVTAKDVDVTGKKGLEIKISETLHSINPRLANYASQGYWYLNNIATSLPPGGGGSDSTETDEIVDEFTRTIQSEQPFFTFVHLMDTHIPYSSDTALAKEYADRYDYENTALSEVAEQFPKDSSTYHKLTPGGSIYEFVEQWCDTEYGIGTAAVEAHYDAAVTEADQRIGEMIAALREKELFDDTLFIVMSDHGESMTEHGIYFDHHGLYNESVHVPLIVRPPGGTDSRHDELVQITDVAPTVLSYLGMTDELESDGQTLAPTIEDGEPVDRDTVYAEEANTQRRRMVYTGEHKLIYSLDNDTRCRYCQVEHAPEVELFDLTTDPEEQTNSATDNEEIVSRLSSLGDQAAEEFTARQPTSDDDEDTVTYDEEEEIFERLDALGYR